MVREWTLCLITSWDCVNSASFTFDWKEACINRHPDLQHLYSLISFFYQFGILVPEEYLSEFFNNHSVPLLLNDLVGHKKYSPITFDTTRSKKKRKFRLRNEKLGEWYFRIKGKNIADIVFIQFTHSVKSTVSANLFLNLIQNPEFKSSEYKKLLQDRNAILIIDRYLHNKKDYTLEDLALLTEKHTILENIGKEVEIQKTKGELANRYIILKKWDKAAELLQNITRTNPYIFDSVKRMALKMPCDFSKAKLKFIQILIEECMSEEERRELQNNYVHTLFITSRYEKSRDYFANNLATDKNSCDDEFREMINHWIPEKLEYLFLTSTIAYSLFERKKYSKSISSVFYIIESLFTLPINFEEINQNTLEHEYEGRLRTIIYRCVIALLTIFDETIEYHEIISNFIQMSIGNNILFDKILFEKILHLKRDYRVTHYQIINLVEKMPNVIDRFIFYSRNKYKNDSDINRIIGLYYLEKQNFKNALSYITKSLKLATNNTQQFYAGFSLALFIINKIDFLSSQGIKNTKIIKERINNAEKVLKTTDDLEHPYYEPLENLKQRLIMIKEEHAPNE